MTGLVLHYAVLAAVGAAGALGALWIADRGEDQRIDDLERSLLKAELRWADHMASRHPDEPPYA